MILQTDAFKKGLGTVLLQNSTPVMFAHRALIGSEGTIKILNVGVWLQYEEWKSSTTFFMERNSLWRQT